MQNVKLLIGFHDLDVIDYDTERILRQCSRNAQMAEEILLHQARRPQEVRVSATIYNLRKDSRRGNQASNRTS